MSTGLSWIVLASLGLARLGPEPPPPRFDEDTQSLSTIEGPREGPRPPSESTEATGIEFAPTTVGETEDSPTRSDPVVGPAEVWPDPGVAPANGAGLFMGSSLILASTPLWTAYLLRDPKLTRQDRIAVLVAAGGLGVLAIGGLGLGGYRQAKLRRWATAYRVVPTRQGGALLTLGGVAVALGLTGVPVGVYWLVHGGLVGWGAVASSVGAVSLGVAPLCLYFGSQRRKAYVETGGWVRRPLPRVRLAPRVTFTESGLGVGVAGQF